jgi:hypothetical protein
MYLVRRVVAIEHRPVAVHNLCIEELLRHSDFEEALNDGVPNDEALLIQVLKE